MIIAIPTTKQTNMRASSRWTPLDAPLNSRQINTPQNAATNVAPLSEPIGNGVTRLAGGDDAERHTDASNDAAKNAGQVSLEIAAKVLRVADRFALDWLHHEDRVEDDIA